MDVGSRDEASIVKGNERKFGNVEQQNDNVKNRATSAAENIKPEAIEKEPHGWVPGGQS